MGERTKVFEQEFANYFGSKYAVMVNSGSSANLLGIAALVYSGKLQRGNEVIVPAVSWSTTYYPLHHYGLKLKFVDISRNTLNIDIDQIEKAISPKTKAIFAVNLLGNANDFKKLSDICNKNDLILIEDNCEALGARFNDKFCGTYGLIGTFSTFYSHHICTMEGGVAVTDNEELYHYMLSLRAHGWTRDLPKNSQLYSRSDDTFYESFNFILPGFNFRPLEIEAAIGIEQIKKIDQIITIRRKNAEIFRDHLSSHPNIDIQEEVGESSWFGFAIILKNRFENKRNLIVKKLIEKGIEVRPIVAGDFTKNSVIDFMDYEISGKLMNAEYIHHNGFFVGNHSKILSKEIKYLAETLKEITI
jgi:CDP-6-deoxy-D-xylo-4-hexulose-3-dehydrase